MLSLQIVYGHAHAAVDRISFLSFTHLPYSVASCMVQLISIPRHKIAEVLC